MINYLDHNATTSILPEVKRLLLREITKMEALNPSSIHSLGREGKDIIEDSRKTVINSVNGNLKDFNVIFTSSGSETNNTVVKGLSEETMLFISAIEHSSLLKPAQNRCNTIIINVTNDGLLDLDHLKNELKNSKSEHKLISVILANNETGVIQDIDAIVKLAKQYNAYVHTDASQAFGKIPLDLIEIPVDALTIASHKIGGPLGAAALIKRKKLKISPLIEGGAQEHNLRAGTENILAILGFSEATKNIKDTIKKYQAQKPNRDYLETELKRIDPNLKIYAQNKNRLPNTSCIASSRFSNEIQQIYFDLENIAISAGSACASGKIDKSHVLEAMDKNDHFIHNAIRVSFGIDSTKDNADHFINAWKKLYNK